MQQVPATLSGFRGLRAELLVALKKALHPLTIRELAEQFELTPNALRRHLDSLEVEELVRHRREVRGVGAPTFAYSLAPAGEALFPQGHAAVLAAVLESVREVSGPDGVIALARRQWAKLVEQAAPRLAELPLPERAQLLAELRSSQGYMAVATCTEDRIVLREHHCAIRDVADRFPEICIAEQQFVERTCHMLTGCSSCAFTVRHRTSESGVATPDQAQP